MADIEQVAIARVAGDCGVLQGALGMQKTWRSAKRGSNLNYYLGCVLVGSVYWDATGPSSTRARWATSVLLPGITVSDRRFENVDEARLFLERRVGTWLGWLEKELPGE